LKDAESIGRRRKLVLPTAQVGEAELEEIAKIGQAGENAKALVAGGSEATERLLSDYEGLDGARMARTPRTAPQRKWIELISTLKSADDFIDDNVMTEARNLRNMTIAQTPLLGDENTPLHTGPGGGTGYEGATPRHQVAFTPNPLATPLHGGATDVSETSRTNSGGINATPFRTPMRDDLSINAGDGFRSIGDTPRERRAMGGALQASFKSLPKPENNFELLVPEDEEEELVNGHTLSVEDAAERDARLKKLQEEEERKALARRSQVVRLDLPRPANVDMDRLLRELEDGGEGASEDAEVRKLVHSELVQILHHDSITHPIPGTSRPGVTRSHYKMPADEDVATANLEIHRELATSLGFPNANEEQVREGLVALAKLEDADDSLSWANVRQQLAFDGSQTWEEPSKLSFEQRIAGYKARLDDSRESMSKDANKASKMEKKLGVTLGGYQARSKALAKRITDAFEELQKAKVDYDSFSRLRINESAAGPRRVMALKEEVERLERREKMLQDRYAELDGERRESESRVASLEEKVMVEAEALNEAALLEMENSYPV
jgi:pre-mRNA-splicing factor CDC5/CEF1